MNRIRPICSARAATRAGAGFGSDKGCNVVATSNLIPNALSDAQSLAEHTGAPVVDERTEGDLHYRGIERCRCALRDLSCSVDERNAAVVPSIGAERVHHVHATILAGGSTSIGHSEPHDRTGLWVVRIVSYIPSDRRHNYNDAAKLGALRQRKPRFRRDLLPACRPAMFTPPGVRDRTDSRNGWSGWLGWSTGDVNRGSRPCLPGRAAASSLRCSCAGVEG